MKVAICVLTYKRPEGLRQLLASLAQLDFTHSHAPEIHVIVIDNDPESSASAICSRLQDGYRWTLRIFHEPRRGISHARNAAIQLTKDTYDFMAFIDDDEVPDPRWLDALILVQRTYQVDVVTGPVLPVFGHAAPVWSVKGGFYERSRHPTGYHMELARTGNVLIHTKVFARDENRFDPRYALTGGEDTHFFLRISKQGHQIIWADEAVVYETVPASRLKLSWILQRAYRAGNTYALCERDIQLPSRKLLLRALKGLVRITMGIILIVPAVVTGRIRLYKALQQISLGAGMVMGLAGRRYEEYKQTHGA